jgi:hypothetical protein
VEQWWLEGRAVRPDVERALASRLKYLEIRRWVRPDGADVDSVVPRPRWVNAEGVSRP